MTEGKRKQAHASPELEDMWLRPFSLYERRHRTWMGNKEAVRPSLQHGRALHAVKISVHEILSLLQLCAG